jgi:hypothetical protein
VSARQATTLKPREFVYLFLLCAIFWIILDYEDGLKESGLTGKEFQAKIAEADPSMLKI